jgi:hypothetical protein
VLDGVALAFASMALELLWSLVVALVLDALPVGAAALLVLASLLGLTLEEEAGGLL